MAACTLDLMKEIISETFANDSALYASPPILINLFDHEHEQNNKKRNRDVWHSTAWMLPVNQLSRAHTVTSTGVVLSLRKDSRTPSWFTDSEVLGFE